MPYDGTSGILLLMSRKMDISKVSAGFTIVLMCAEAQGPVGQGGPVYLPKKKILRWIFAYVVQFDAVYMSGLI